MADLGVNYEIIKKSGSWFSYGDTKLAKEEMPLKHSTDNPDLMDELEEKIMATLNAKLSG